MTCIKTPLKLSNRLWRNVDFNSLQWINLLKDTFLRLFKQKIDQWLVKCWTNTFQSLFCATLPLFQLSHFYTLALLVFFCLATLEINYTKHITRANLTTYLKVVTIKIINIYLIENRKTKSTNISNQTPQKTWSWPLINYSDVPLCSSCCASAGKKLKHSSSNDDFL